jgi:predicted SprT family Zn-dependent metalloprotease
MKHEGVQLGLPFSLSEDSLRERLRRAAGREISLTLTDNATSMISVRQKEDRMSVRLHRMFLQADDALIGEIALFIRRRKGRTPLIRDFIRLQSAAIRKREPRRLIPTPRGEHHDLGKLAESINREYFSGKITASITWGARRRGRYVRRRTLGSYSIQTNTIRINPVLDRKTVPCYFIRFIVYHEMLHADMGCDEKGGRRSMHSGEFRRRERMFKEYTQALSWEKEIALF